MRQGQQNRRGRSRGRKPQNPLSRNFESNGPDVKIRGTAAHIAEKYNSLARDALASGDLVQAENYLQHAEHYNRIIMAAQAHTHGSGMDANGNGQHRPRRPGEAGFSTDDDYDDDMDGDDEPAMEHIPGRNEQPVVHDAFGHTSQAIPGGSPMASTEHAEQHRSSERHERGERQDRGERQERVERQERGERGERHERGGERLDRSRQRRTRSHSRPRTHSHEGEGAADAPVVSTGESVQS
ncbi:MAG: DUF4167 domain-containing protein [Rhizobiales bacterium]|nr:DUF4167 domain-containing protein [Hyphomicrobiales bacterium]